MADTHPFGAAFETHLRATQQAYADRRAGDYLAGFADHYYSVQLGTYRSEDKAQLRTKIERDIERFKLLQMDLEVLRIWFAHDTGFGHLSYNTRLRQNGDSRVLVDRRENILVSEHLGQGRWLITCKIVLKAENFYE